MSVAAAIVVIFGVWVAALGVAGAAAPRRLLERVTRVQRRLGPGFVAALRIALGAALLLAAGGSRAPLYLRGLGVLSLLSGAATPFFGRRRFDAMLGWWRARPARFVRLWSLFVLLFGASLVWAALPR